MLIGQSIPFNDVVNKIRKVAGFGASRVLITGESGTGKELIARAIHASGPRSDGPFIAVNCSAITAELAESTFFGHSKGSFTGAVADRQGYFELANDGTLFLDEVGDMPLPLQVKLLRVLEEGEVFPVGAAQAVKINTNVVAASNADFKTRIADNAFRQDLYFRLARFTVEAPALRQRSGDIELLTRHFLQLFAREMNLPLPKLSDPAKALLLSYDFPGNVRELKNILERAVMECEGQTLSPHHLHFFGDLPPSKPTTEPADSSNPEPTTKVESEEELILRYLRKNPSLSNSLCRTLINADRNRATYVLRKMVDSDQITVSGQGRWARYSLP